ncbi:MAG: TIGR02996 domain-containing protein [Proteobacteria bacterium]|nr:TIGR02996 domain-containing protein [Pseudomonadota bacterium]
MLVSIYHLHDTERARARRLPVTKPQLLVGSDPKCDIRIIDDDQVSPRHMTIAVRVSASDLVAEIHVTPLAGATLINNTIISDTSQAKLGDTIRIGNTILKFRPDAVVSTTATPDEARRNEPPRPSAPPARPERPTHTNPTAPQRYPTPPGNPPPPPRPVPSINLAPRLPPLVVPHAIRTVCATDPTEDQFLVAIRANPTDTASRMVYSDWLEQRGLAAHAAFVRDESGEISDATFLAESDLDWRAITSRTAIDHCTKPRCPRVWDRLVAMTDDERSRYCGTCQQRVYFCDDLDLLRQLGLRGLPVALDASIDRVTAHVTYTNGPGPLGVDNTNPRVPVFTVTVENPNPPSPTLVDLVPAPPDATVDTPGAPIDTLQDE